MQPEILTYTGKYFDFLHPEKMTFDIRDIAHALANLCRFTGHVREFYSVAQHSVYVSRVAGVTDRRAALLHDAAEAYLGDVSSPLKALLPEYKIIERNVEHALCRQFDLPYPLPASIKLADLVMLATEKRDLMPKENTQWILLEGIEPIEEKIIPLGPREAEWQFLMRAKELGLSGLK